MSNDIEKEVNLGGTVERALSGNYDLKVGEVLKEAWTQTVKNFLSFTPAIITLIFIQIAVFFIALKLQLGDPSVVLTLFEATDNPDVNALQSIVQAIYVANLSYEVISAPLYAGICLMAMSHAAGLGTKSRHMLKGLQFTVPIIIATLAVVILQYLIQTLLPGFIVPYLSMYMMVAFSNSLLLICEKQVPPMQSLLLSLRAVNKKLFVLSGIYLFVLLMFFAGMMFYGLGLIFVLPFFFHVKGIVYRNMFGIKLKIVASASSHDNDDDNNNSQVFNA
ncbi:DUF2189 domain-containing protein [Vibrio taketomensis]|uniref:hypothetical protein n=1 Tax=Vibrio taketomensis TaxID=2572923 RepID=UPI001389CECD|nr:hypothetical protein [Vibrio taketomensis]